MPKPTGPSDYTAIRARGKDELWETAADWGKRVFDEQYDDPAHFLLELLQNAEDALARRARKPPKAKRGVAFELTGDGLRFRHFGDPFDRADVESICRIGQSTKKLDDIGRFGLGFKSVYAFTDRPRIHSGPEDFAIVDYFKPEACEPMASRGRDETVIEVPRTSGRGDWDRLSASMDEMLSPVNLLFLRHIESVRWTNVRGSTTTCDRKAERIDRNVRRVTITQAPSGDEPPRADHWLVFSQPVQVDRDRHVQIAFRQDPERATANRIGIEPVPHSRLYAYFPTNEDTRVGFLIQGPYNTTPARDSVRKHDEWNERLVTETATLLRSALRWFRYHGGITTEILSCLPLDRSDFIDTMFEPLFTETLDAFCTQKLLPTYDGAHVAVDRARLGGGDHLRALFKEQILGELCRVSGGVHWLRGDITRDSAREVYRYVRDELKVEVLNPRNIVGLLDRDFLMARTDAWIRRFYAFLVEQEGLQGLLRRKPIVRLADGSQVRPPGDSDPGVFLPGPTRTRFRTVRESVCDTDDARRFLESMGIREADVVDDVIANRLPVYGDNGPIFDDGDYMADLERIEAASMTDSREARQRLIERLEDTRWVKVVDSWGAASGWRRPAEVYAPTPLLRDLFDGIQGTNFWDSSVFPSDSDSLPRLLKQCGVADRLRPKRPRLSMDEQRAILLRENVPSVQGRRVDDWTLEGIRRVLRAIPEIEGSERDGRSERLWEALVEWWRGESPVRRERVCRGTAKWSHYGPQEKHFDASFVVLLRSMPWVACGGTLQAPKDVVFSSTGWEDEPGLHALLGFKDEEDARREEVEGMLRLLEESGISDLDALRARLAGSEWADGDQDEEGATDGGYLPEGEALVPEGTLEDVAKWWDEAGDEERRKYAPDAYPAGFRPERLRDGGRAEWFTMFALASFRSYGRTQETQHRGFINRAIAEGWWNDLANSRPPENMEPWLERLDRWSDAGQTLQDQKFSMWRESFVALYTVARWLDEYILVMRHFPDIVEEAERPVLLRDVMNPTYSPSVRKLGVEAAPLARTVGMGINWMIRELVRSGFYERGGVMAPYSWMPSRRARRFLETQGLGIPDGNPDHSLSIHEFVCGKLGSEVAEFHGDYDLPLQLWTRRRRGRQ